MAFAIIGYTDQTGKAVMRPTSCARLSHAAEVAERMEAMSRRLRLRLDLSKARPAEVTCSGCGLHHTRGHARECSSREVAS